MSIKIGFMHYRNYITRTRVKLPVVFEEFDMVFIFWLLFSFHYPCQLVTRSTLAKSRGLQSTPSPPGFYGPEVNVCQTRKLQSIGHDAKQEENNRTTSNCIQKSEYPLE